MNARNTGGGRQREVTGRTVLVYLVTFFAIVAAVNAVMISVAITTFGGVETANAYQAGLAYASEEAAARAQDARHWHVGAELEPRPDGLTAIALTARDAADRPLIDLEARVSLIHPTDRRFDQTIAMRAGGPGVFHGSGALAAGQWDLVIELVRRGERMFRSKERVILR